MYETTMRASCAVQTLGERTCSGSGGLSSDVNAAARNPVSLSTVGGGVDTALEEVDTARVVAVKPPVVSLLMLLRSFRSALLSANNSVLAAALHH